MQYYSYSFFIHSIYFSFRNPSVFSIMQTHRHSQTRKQRHVFWFWKLSLTFNWFAIAQELCNYIRLFRTPEQAHTIQVLSHDYVNPLFEIFEEHL